MATFDQLPAEQRAIIELVLRQGKTYAELAEMLGMPEDRVRELARDSLSELAPVTSGGVDAEWRGQLADYILGQQAGPEVTATRGHLRRSEPARAWTRSLLDSLDQLYPNGLPEIPQSGRAVAAGPRTPVDPAVQRRRLIAAGAGLIALLLVVVLLWPVGLLTGGDDSSPSASSGDTTTTGAGTGDQAAKSTKPAGVAVVALRQGKYQLLVQATNLPPLKPKQAYEVWLYNSDGDAKSLGAQVVDQSGAYQGVSNPLTKAEIARYRSVDLSLERADQVAAHSGVSVLRGELVKIKGAPKQGDATLMSRALLEPPPG